MAAPVEDARAYVMEQKVGHADETGWRERRKKAQLWVFATALDAVFLIHPGRNKAAARELLATFLGTLVAGRW